MEVCSHGIIYQLIRTIIDEQLSHQLVHLYANIKIIYSSNKVWLHLFMIINQLT